MIFQGLKFGDLPVLGLVVSLMLGFKFWHCSGIVETKMDKGFSSSAPLFWTALRLSFLTVLVLVLSLLAASILVQTPRFTGSRAWGRVRDLRFGVGPQARVLRMWGLRHKGPAAFDYIYIYIYI